MKRVGVLVGREKTFPEAVIKGINERGRGDVVAEYIKLGGIKFDDPPRYDLVIDRISHEVPFYRATLKRLALEGTIKPQDITVERASTGSVLHVNYDKQIPFVYNIDFLLHFDKSEPLPGNVAL